MKAVWIAEDRSLLVHRTHHIVTRWIDIDLCKLGNRTPMAVATLEKKAQRLICMGENNASWPPIVGCWKDDRFVVCDGRHEYLASLMLGRTEVFVCWLEKETSE